VGNDMQVNQGDIAMQSNPTVYEYARKTNAVIFLQAVHCVKMQATFLDEYDAEFTAHQRLTLETRWAKTVNTALKFYELARKDYLDNRKNNAC
jgi:hypothetical protein